MWAYVYDVWCANFVYEMYASICVYVYVYACCTFLRFVRLCRFVHSFIHFWCTHARTHTHNNALARTEPKSKRRCKREPYLLLSILYGFCIHELLRMLDYVIFSLLSISRKCGKGVRTEQNQMEWDWSLVWNENENGNGNGNWELKSIIVENTLKSLPCVQCECVCVCICSSNLFVGWDIIYFVRYVRERMNERTLVRWFVCAQYSSTGFFSLSLSPRPTEKLQQQQQ